MGITINTAKFIKELDDYAENLRKKILDNLLHILKTEFIPIAVSRLMELYDGLIANSAMKEDPANPANSDVREAFKNSVSKSLNQTLVNRGYDEIKISTGNKDELGYGKHNLQYLKKGVPKNPAPLDWLIFFLEGFIGEYYFVEYEDYVRLRPQVSADTFSEWGWFGKGFLIPASSKSDLVVKGNLKKHPFSGLKPTPIFDKIMDNINFDDYINKAIETTLKEK
jgi:hypothetical protein